MLHSTKKKGGRFEFWVTQMTGHWAAAFHQFEGGLFFISKSFSSIAFPFIALHLKWKIILFFFVFNSNWFFFFFISNGICSTIRDGPPRRTLSSELFCSTRVDSFSFLPSSRCYNTVIVIVLFRLQKKREKKELAVF